MDSISEEEIDSENEYDTEKSVNFIFKFESTKIFSGLISICIILHL